MLCFYLCYAVVIEELPDEPGLNVSKKKIENQERSLVSISKKSKHQEANGSTRGSIEGHEDTNGDGNLKQESEDLKTSGVTDYKHTSSSEDEDGFHVKRKRKLKDDDNIQPSKKKYAQAVEFHKLRSILLSFSCLILRILTTLQVSGYTG